MCGRARCTLAPQDVARACGFPANTRTLNSDRFRPSYNIAPGSYLPVVCYESKESSNEPVVHCMKWGLVPSFTKKGTKPDHYRMFNARSESVHQKASFNRLLSKHRCLVSVEGFYEWKKNGAKKQPYYLHFQDGHPLVFAALHDRCELSEGEVLHTFTILTTRCSNRLEWLHDRMPVILGSAENIHAWIDQDISKLEVQKLLQPYEGNDLAWYPVTPAMGKPSFDGPECVEESQQKTVSKGLMPQLFSKAKPDMSGFESGYSAGISSEKLSSTKAPSNVDLPEVALNEEEMRALIAAIEPEEKQNEIEVNRNDGENVWDGNNVKVQKFNGSELPERHNKTSQETDEDELQSATKRRKFAESPKSRKGTSTIHKDHQKTLLTFFHKR